MAQATTLSPPSQKASGFRIGGVSSYLLLVPGLVISLIFMLLPLAIMTVVSFFTPAPMATGYLQIFTIQNYIDFFAAPNTPSLLFTTFSLALVASVICFVFGFPLAYFLTFRIKSAAFKNYVITLLIVPFLIDSSIRTVAWIAILGKGGIVNYALLASGIINSPLSALLFSRNTLYIIWLQTYIVFMEFPIYLAMNRIDPDLIWAAKVLKAPPHRVLYDIVFKLSLPGIICGFVFVFVSTLGDYVTPGLWAGGIQTMGLTISMYSDNFLWPYASVISTILLLISIAVLYICFKLVDIKKLVYE
jgi:putative spermidine/putrescine transport system permease protein